MKKQDVILIAIALGVLATGAAYVSAQPMIVAIIALSFYSILLTLVTLGVRVDREFISDCIASGMFCAFIVLTALSSDYWGKPVDTVTFLTALMFGCILLIVPFAYFLDKHHRKDNTYASKYKDNLNGLVVGEIDPVICGLRNALILKEARIKAIRPLTAEDEEDFRIEEEWIYQLELDKDALQAFKDSALAI